MRPLAELDKSPASLWTAEEAFAHLCATFDEVARQFPQLMEPYAILLGDTEAPIAKTDIMRRGLRETFKQRYPMRESEGA